MKNKIIRMFGNLFLSNLARMGNYQLVKDATFNMEGMATNKNSDFTNDPLFIKSYNAAVSIDGDLELSKWIIHITQWAAYHGMTLGKGDFVECGVHKGRHAKSIVTFLGLETLVDRNFYLIDSFAGLSKKYSTDEELAQYQDEYYDTSEIVKKEFKNYNNVKIIKGVVPEVLDTLKITEVAFIHIDMNSAIPELEAIKWFWPKMIAGAICVFDDYAQRGHEKQKQVLDDFFSAIRIRVLPLPTGQGLVIKNQDVH